MQTAATDRGQVKSAECRPSERKHRTGSGVSRRMFIGKSDAIRRVLEQAHAVAHTDATVMIEGESGTGKELIARLIHDESARAGRPFVSVNCAAFAEPLLEGELFGHVKGAFTGALTTKPGRFQLADGGTLFLDEIGDLSPKGQGDLLRVLEDGAFRMVGGTELVRVDVRIVTATNQKLGEAVAKGRFREDLYYRLHVVPVEVPPLRARRDDVPLLISAFLDDFAAKHESPLQTLSAEAMQACTEYYWPGNVRQLRNTIERVVITCRKPVIEVQDLPKFVHADANAGGPCEIRAGMTIAECEKLLIEQTLINATSNRERAARMLGISRRALQYKLKEYGLVVPRIPGAPRN
jgi:transcriptional regulator with PAS, ATPase and Fis domain